MTHAPAIYDLKSDSLYSFAGDSHDFHGYRGDSDFKADFCGVGNEIDSLLLGEATSLVFRN